MNKTGYMPFTATPFYQNETYREVLPRNAELAGYIRCFWGSERPYVSGDGREKCSMVIPDTCADIIYEIDHTGNFVTGGFCGINDQPFSADRAAAEGHLVSTFAIRFYGWGAYAFSEDSFRETRNGFFEIPSRFGWLDRQLRQQLLVKRTLAERMEAAEELFLKKLPYIRKNNIVDIAVQYMILGSGAVGAGELAKECFVSGRQLERLFHEYIGITPKKLGNLVRYQLLWNDIMRSGRFCVLDAVQRYGYTDQSHLMREFKRYHSMDIRSAVLHARSAGRMSEIYKTFCGDDRIMDCRKEGFQDGYI